MFEKKYIVKLSFIITSFILLFFSNSAISQNCTVNAGIASTICNNQSMQLSGSSSGLFSTNAFWTQVGGPSVIIADPTNLNSSISGYIGGQTYTFRLSATCDDAVAVFDEVVITVNQVSNADAGLDQLSCPGTDVINLNANTAGANESGTWSIISNAGGVSGLNITDPLTSVDLSNTFAGVSVLQWSISNSNGCSSTDDVSITNYGGITPVSAGSDQNLSNCYSSTQSTNLSAAFAGDGTGGQIGTWSLVSGPNYPIIADINAENTNISNLVEGIYVLRWSVTGPCINSSDEITITVPEASQNVTTASSPDLRFCYGTTSAILEGTTPQYTNEVVSWNQNGGPAGVIISDPNSPTTSISGLNGSSTYRFSYTITNSLTGCSSADNSVNIRFTNPPAIDVGADQALNCGINSVSISPVVSGGTSTRYRITNGPITSPGWINDNNSNVVINNLNQEGTYSIQFERYSTGIGCTSAFDNINVTISESPSIANAGPDQVLACNIVETDLSGNVPVSGTGMWSQVSGPGNATITDPFNETTHISNLIEGQYVFRWVISGGNKCPVDQDEVSIIVSENAPIVSAGPDRSVCHSTEIILDGNAPNSGALGSWSVNPSTGISFSNLNDPTSSVFGMQANTAYTFTWTISNQCQVVSEDVIITTGSIAGPGPANAGGDQCIPAGTSTIFLDGNLPSAGIGLWTVLSGPNSPAITDNTLSNTSVTGLIDGHYLFEWSVNISGCDATKDTIMASIVSGITASNAGADESVCGSSVVLSANSPGTYETGHWKQISGNTGYTFSDINTHNATVTGLLPGRYEFSWILEKGSCPSSTDNLLITVSEPPEIATAASDYTVCSSNTATLSANNPVVGTGVWSLVGSATNSPSFVSYSSPTTTVNGLTTGAYQFKWTITSDSDCPEQTDVMIIQVSAPAIAQPDKNLCNVTKTFLEGTTGSDGTWTLSPLNTGAPAPTITNNAYHTADVIDMALDQTYIFRYTTPIIYGCSSTVDDLTVNTSFYGTDPDAGPDQEICTSGGNSVTMAANVPGMGVGSWNQLSGPNSANIVNPGLNSTDIGNLIAGVYTFEWNVDYNYCGNYSDVVKITVNAPPTLSDAGPDQINACQLDAQLAGNLPSIGTGTWALVSAPTANATTAVVIDNPSLPGSTISNISDPGAYELSWTITNGSVCAASATNVILTFTADPPTTPNAGIDQELCDVNSFTMDGNNPAIGTGTWSLISGPGGVSISNPSIFNTDVTGIISGTYEFQWEISSGGCTLADNVYFTNSATPPTANASSTDPQICEFNTLLLVGNDPGPGIGSWSFVSGPSTPMIDSPNSQNSNVTGTTIGAYTFKWTIVNGACASTEDNITVDIVNNPATNLNVSGDEVCNGSDATVTIFSSENLVDYSLYIAGNLVGTISGDGSDIVSNISSADLVTGNNYVNITATNANNCSVGLDNQAIIIVNVNPSTSNAVSDDVVCENEDAIITISNSQNGVNYEAYKGLNLVGSGTGNGGNLDITMATDGTWVTTSAITITATSVSTSCVSNLSNQATVTVNVKPLTDRIISGSTTCFGLDGTVTISGSETGINYEAFIGTTSVGSGAGNAGDLEIAINAGSLAIGNNTIYLVATNSSSSCFDTLINKATVVVVNPPLLDKNVIGDTVCDNFDATIDIISSESGVVYNYYIGVNQVATITGNGGDINATINSSWLNVGSNSINITASNSGCTQNLINQAIVDVNANPDAALSISGSTICENTNGSITISNSENGINYEVFLGTQSVSTGSGDGNDLIMSILSANLTLGVDSFQIIATNPATGCFVNMSTEPTINVNANPDQTIELTGSTICEGNDGTITILNAESGNTYEAFMGTNSIGTAFGAATNLDLLVSNSDLVLGNNVIDVLATTSENCSEYLNNQAFIIVNALPINNLQINNSEICNGDTAVIGIQGSESDIKYELFINSELVAEGIGNGALLGIIVPYGKYQVGSNYVNVLATNTSTMCSLEMNEQAEIIVKACQIVVYNGFSPNNDGINETFTIDGLINYPNNKVTIFNRWGNKVFEASPYLNDWDGTSSFGITLGGKKLPVGTYFYIIEPGNGEKPIKGYIYLNR